MALTALGLCNRALIRIGCNPITSFTDGSAEASIADALYAQARDAALSSYGWSFATRQTALTMLSENPAADYQKAYGLPADFLRALSAGIGGRGRGLDYRIFRGTLHANAEGVILTYICRPEEEEFPPFFDAALITRLAADFCIPLTESTSRAETLYRLSDSEFARARQVDAQQDTPARLEHFPLIDARG